MAGRLEPTEYGGSDTSKTHGIFPENTKLEETERMRLMYATDASDPEPLETGLGGS